MIVLLIAFHATSHLLAYGNDREAAEKELATLRELMGRDRWGSNGKENSPTHTVRCPTGDVVVLLEKIEVSRLVDTKIEVDLLAETQTEEENRALEREIRWRTALAETPKPKQI